ncbi:TIGR04283 family arsenosugar biosynthesis glycosyltransferase [Ruegeria sp. Ofav3-42]|uniref:TIGR04283 family arsenosugar biosynthesis glycosyltransferase n=1 Tax=Ruegeria sp. Ofav3-42 TaxID=2917759 RepID=UPI001EF60F25|nr:TIGR04283 family arsenosugar biosynthesis glycosyltransferase [Ruegeria sp. Ofav3-42]
MPAPISIVIPTLNSGETLPATLGALMEGLHAGLIRELIVTDGGSTDQTLEIADEAGAEIVTGPASRGGQLRRGCAAAKGEWLLVLHADTILQEGWSKVVGDHLRSGDPATFRLAFRSSGFAPTWVAGWANLRSRLFGLPYGDQGLLIPRAMYQKVGGYRDQPLMEDVALARSLSGIKLLPCRAFTSADRYERAGWMRRGARNLWTLTRYYLGVDPERLAQDYRR